LFDCTSSELIRKAISANDGLEWFFMWLTAQQEAQYCSNRGFLPLLRDTAQKTQSTVFIEIDGWCGLR